jgi:hypothetical protein
VTRDQRYKYEMLIRVRDFGFAHRDRFPPASTGGAGFARVAAALEAIDEHLEHRVLGQANGRKVKDTTRAAVFDYMKILAKAGRRAALDEPGRSAFRMPPRRTQKVELATARAFIVEATKWQETFILLGLPSTFLSDFTALVDRLQIAVDTRLNSKTVRGEAQAGIAAELARGFGAVLDLDVLIAVVAREDSIMGPAWLSARRIEGQRRRRVRGGAIASDRDSPASAPPALVPRRTAVDVAGTV